MSFTHTTGNYNPLHHRDTTPEEQRAIKRAHAHRRAQEAVSDYRRQQERAAKMSEINARIAANNAAAAATEAAQVSLDEYATMSPTERQQAREEGRADQARGVGNYTNPTIKQ